MNNSISELTKAWSKKPSIMLENEAATVNAGHKFAETVGSSELCVYLYGDLGAGKTTLCRGIVQGYGHSGKVKSPTYTLVEPYELPNKNIFHFDLYRLASAEELQFMGLDEYFSSPARLCLIEWPEKGQGFIPDPDIALLLSDVDAGRKLFINAYSEQGKKVADRLIVMLTDWINNA